jgi:hypothetical protein
VELPHVLERTQVPFGVACVSTTCGAKVDNVMLSSDELVVFPKSLLNLG